VWQVVKQSGEMHLESKTREDRKGEMLRKRREDEGELLAALYICFSVKAGTAEREGEDGGEGRMREREKDLANVNEMEMSFCSLHNKNRGT